MIASDAMHTDINVFILDIVTVIVVDINIVITIVIDFNISS